MPFLYLLKSKAIDENSARKKVSSLSNHNISITRIKNCGNLYLLGNRHFY